MHELRTVFIMFVPLILIASECDRGAPNGGANARESARVNKAAVEVPAPLQPAGKTLAYNFDAEKPGTVPSSFHSALTGQGAKAEWSVQPDSSAPSQPNVLAQTSNDKTDYRFPLAILDDGSFQDLELSVRFKAVSGEIDQAAGLVFRLKDSNSYYIVRANALEGNYRLYHVVSGKRQQFAGANVKLAAGEWHEMRVECTGNRIVCYFDGEKKIESSDETFKDAGKVGLWTKADSITYFDDLRVSAR